MTTPDGTVTRELPEFTKPQPRTVSVEVKSKEINGELHWSWWVKVDRHPYSNKLSYTTAELAQEAAITWVEANYPTRRIVLGGDL